MGAETSDCYSTEAQLQRTFSPNNTQAKPRPSEKSFLYDEKSDGATASSKPIDNPNNIPSRSRGRSNNVSKSDSQSQIKDNIIGGWKSAIKSNNDSLMRHLYEEHGKDYDFKKVYFENGNNALHMGCELKNVNMVKFILDHKICKINSVNSNGYSALHIACMQRDYSMVKELVKSKYGASLTIECNITVGNGNGNGDGNVRHGMSPIDIAKMNDCHDIASLIQSKIDKRSKKKKIARSQTMVDNNSHNNYNNNNYEFENGNENDWKNGENSENFEVRERNDTQSLTQEETEREQRELDLIKIASRNPLRGNKMVSKAHDSDNDINDKNKNNNKNKNKNNKSKHKPKRHSYSVAGRGRGQSHGEDIFSAKKRNLPVLKGAMQKQQPAFPWTWQKRYVCIKDRYMIWNDKDINDDILTNDNIYDVNKAKVRKQFKNCLAINVIHKVAKYEDAYVKNSKLKDKNEKRLVIYARDPKKEASGEKDKEREYIWECESKEERNKWVDGIQKYRNFYQKLYQYRGSVYQY